MDINLRRSAVPYHAPGLDDPLWFAGLTPEGWQLVTRRTLLAMGVVAGGAALGGAVAANSYAAAMRTANAAIDPGLSSLVDTRLGPLEYAERGTGTPLLMVHGTGGGFDQGLMFAHGLVERGYRVIAPSRFGYLRSSLPADPSSANQADVFVDLLDHLGIDKIAIAGGSAGALSAIDFAIRHPDRCAALVPIVPATYVPSRDAVTADNAPAGVEAAMQLFRSDFLFWAAIRTVPDLLVGTLLATDPALLATVSRAEAARAEAVLWSLLPVSRRVDGMANDARLAGHPAPAALTEITAPVLTISVEDDRFGTALAARHIAATIKHANLVMFPSGGHIFLGHDNDMTDQMDLFFQRIGYA